MSVLYKKELLHVSYETLKKVKINEKKKKKKKKKKIKKNKKKKKKEKKKRPGINVAGIIIAVCGLN